MRRMSEKARKVYAEAKPIRDALRAEVKRCECCGRKESDRFRGNFDVHEILNGPLRMKTLGERCSLLVVCRECHDERVHGSTTLSASGRAAFQLALLLRSRPNDFDLERFNWLRNPNAPNFVVVEQVNDQLKGLNQ